MKKGAPSTAAVAELEQAFKDEEITIRDLVATINDVRTEAMRHSTKTGEEVGPDYVTRLKAAEDLLALKGLPSKNADKVPPATPAKIRELAK